MWFGLPGESVVNGHSDEVLYGEVEQGGDVHLEGDVAAAVVTRVLAVNVHGRCVVDRSKPVGKSTNRK
jgi:hypothetical protein